MDTIIIPDIENGPAKGAHAAPRRAFALGALLPMLILLLIYWKLEVWPLGGKTLLEADAVHQYLPFLTELRRHLVGSEALFYSFSGGLGYNFWSTVAYYAASPLNLLTALIPEENVCDFMAWITVLKLGFAGGIMAWYLCRRERGNIPAAVALGTMYALSNFFLSYKYNLMWLDSIAVAPLILFGLERMLHERRSDVYMASLFFALWCNYYIGYMLCLFACLYLVFLLYAEAERGERIPCLIRFAVASLLAGGMAAALLLPTWLALRVSSAADYTARPGLKLYASLVELLRAHAFDAEIFHISYERGDVQIYCGVLVLPLIVLYYLNPAIDKKRRLGMAALTGLLLFSFQFSPLNYVWHGFHMESGVPNRFAFLYLILLMLQCHASLCALRELGLRRFLIGMGAALLFTAAYAVYEASALHSFKLFATLWALLLCAPLLYARVRGAGRRAEISLILCVLMVGEAAFHSRQELLRIGSGTRDFYIDYQRDTQTLLETAGAEGFSRGEIDSESVVNFSTYAGLNGLALFNSGIQGDVQKFFNNMHVYTHLNTVRYRGVSKFLKDILGQRWLVSSQFNADTLNGMVKVGQLNGKTLYENREALPVGFLVAPEIVDWDPSAGGGMDAENSFVTLATGLPELYQQSEYFVGRSDVTYKLPIPEDSFCCVLLDTTPESIEWKTPEFKRVYNNYNRFLLEAYAPGPEQYAALKVTTGGAKYTGRAWVCSDADYRRVISALGESRLTGVTAAGNRLGGTIDAKRDGMLLLTVPFDPGWSIRVDGDPVEPVRIGGALTGVPLTKGEHTLEMRYTPPGFRAGLALSLMSLALALFWLLWERRAFAWELRRRVRENPPGRPVPRPSLRFEQIAAWVVPAVIVPAFLLRLPENARKGALPLLAAALSAALFCLAYRRCLPGCLDFCRSRETACRPPEVSRRTDAMVLLMFLLSLTGHLALATAARLIGGLDKNLAGALDFWRSIDSHFYLSIAQKGYTVRYEDGLMRNLAFFPGYPMLIDVFHLIFPNRTLCAFLAAWTPYLCAGPVLYRLLRLDFDHARCMRVLLLVCLAPAAVFFSYPMGEPLYLLLTVLSLYMARTGRWKWAGLSGMLCACTRSAGVLLLLPLGMELWRQEAGQRTERRSLWRKGGWLLTVPLGVLFYLWINKRAAGDAFAFSAVQKSFWSQELGWFFSTAATQTRSLLNACADAPKKVFGLWLPNLLTGLGSLWLMLYGGRRLRPSWAAWFFPYFMLSYGVTWLLSGPRYMAVFFPLAVAADELPGRRRLIPLTALLLSAAYTVMFALRWSIW